MENLLEWANILHGKITGVVWHCAKNWGIFTIQLFFHHSDEYGVFSQIWSFAGKVYFIVWIWKLIIK